MNSASWVSLTSDHPDWNKRLTELGYPEDWLTQGGYNSSMTLGQYFTQPGKNIAGLTIPSRNIVYLGDGYRNGTGKNYLYTPAHEALHLMFGSHLDIAMALQNGVGILSGEDLFKMSEKELSDIIDDWAFNKRCGNQ